MIKARRRCGSAVLWTGTVTDTYDYDAWGNVVSQTGSTPNSYLYRGEQFDSDLDLYYLRARYFNSSSGSFLTPDRRASSVQIPATLHKYLYARADPVNLEDPSGLDATGAALQEGFIVVPGAHALAHLTEMTASGYLEGLTEQEVVDAVEEAIREVVQPGTPVGQWYPDFMLYVNQRIPVFWRAFVVSDALVTISTIYPVRWQ